MIDTAFNVHDYYTGPELCEQLGVPHTTIRLWTRNGRIPAEAVLKRGGRYFYHCDVIDPLIDAGMLKRQISAAFSQSNDFYTTHELAEQLVVCDSTVNSWLLAGRIPSHAAFLCDGKYFFHRAVIDPMIDDGLLTPDHRTGVGLPEPNPADLIKIDNLELLPEEYARYLLFRKRYDAGLKDSSRSFAENSFGTSGTRKNPPR